jgi:hypothetical protein
MPSKQGAMRLRVKKLPRVSLEEIALCAITSLWFDDNGRHEPDKGVSGADFVDAMIDILSRHGLALTDSPSGD